jgi:tripartite-type tricarboxylate transporter receptor subunit TctC
MTGLDMVHIPYKVKAGTVRPLAVTTAKRSSAAPQVPTMAEAGLPGYETSTWGGLLAPAGTPKAVVVRLNTEVNRILALPDVRQRLQDAGIEAAGGSPQQFSDFLGTEMVKWAKVAKDAGIQAE